MRNSRLGQRGDYSWNNVCGSISVEVAKDENGKWIDVDGKDLPFSVAKELEPLFVNVANEDAYAELVIDFTSSGYYDPGSMYGGWQNLGSPPEGEDERLLDGVVEIRMPPNKDNNKLSNIASNDLFGAYFDRIESEELDYDDFDPPDRDDY